MNSAFLFGGCGAKTPAVEQEYLVVALRSAPNSLNPLAANDEVTARVGQVVFSSLLVFGDDLRPKPHLAERIDEPDPRTYIAHLRRGVRFHDGTPLTARDVVYTFSLFLDPAYITPYKGAFTQLASVRALDDDTVEFRLKTPYASFPTSCLVPIPILPYGREQEMATHPIGSGPYEFVRYATDDQVVLKAFAGYFQGPPANRGLVLKVIPDDTMRGLELRKRTADLVLNDMNPDIVYGLESRRDVVVSRSPGLDFSYLSANMRDPVVSKKAVRQAIGFAIDRHAIIKFLRRDLATPAFGLVPPNGWAFEPDVFTYRFDPDRAKQLLDEAGYPDPDGDGPRPRLALSLKIGTSEETRLQATAIQQDLARVGIALDVRSHEQATLFADLVKGNFQLANPQWVGGAVVDPDILRRVFHSQQVPPAGFNRGRYSNPEVDRLLDLAATATTEAERRQYYSQVQKLVAEDGPYIPIWNRVNYIVAQPGLTGLHVNPTGDFLALKDVRKATT